jgi:hypothetical protein
MDDQIPRIELVSPESMGWLKVGNRAWELPDGTIHRFPPGVEELIFRLIKPSGRK